MNRVVTWILFFGLASQLVAWTLQHWVPLPALGNIGFTLLFTMFSLSHAWSTRGWRWALAFFGLSAVVSWLFEHFGVLTGAVYGAYHYGDLLGTKLGGVPLVIPLGWFMMIYPSWCVAGVLLGSEEADPPAAAIVARSLIAAMVMTMWDTVMDPGMAKAGNWVWHDGGPYFGVPLLNYLGWLETTFTVYVLSGFTLRRFARPPEISPRPRAFAFLPVIVYALFSVRYLVPRDIEAFNALRIVAGFTMGFASMLALCRLGLSRGRDAAGT